MIKQTPDFTTEIFIKKQNKFHYKAAETFETSYKMAIQNTNVHIS